MRTTFIFTKLLLKLIFLALPFHSFIGKVVGKKHVTNFLT
jgi:hypothetical protein